MQRTMWHVNDILHGINEGLRVNEALAMQINDKTLFFVSSRAYANMRMHARYERDPIETKNNSDKNYARSIYPGAEDRKYRD